MGPRGEFVKEFEEQTGKFFHMYSPDRFLKFAQEYLKVKVNEEALEEIKEIKKEDEKKSLADMAKNNEPGIFEEKKNRKYDSIYYKNLYDNFGKYEDERNSLMSKFLNVQAENMRLEYIVKELYEGKFEDSLEFKDLIDSISDNKKYMDSLQISIKKMEARMIENNYNKFGGPSM